MVAGATVGAHHDLGLEVCTVLAAEQFEGARSDEFEIIEMGVDAEDSHALG